MLPSIKSFIEYMNRYHETTMGDRKALKSTDGMIIGHTGSGKSMILKLTEIGQTLLRTKVNIFMIDPQSEMREIVKPFGGNFFRPFRIIQSESRPVPSGVGRQNHSV